MIIDTLKATNSVMLDSIQVTNNKQAAKIFKEQIIALGSCAPTLEQLLNIITALRDKQIAPGILTAELKETLQTSVDNCGEKTHDHTLDAATVQALKNAIDLCKTSTENTWKAAADKQCMTVIGSLRSLKSLLPNKKEADELAVKIRKMPLCDHCRYCRCKDLEAFEMEAAELDGDHKKALELARQGHEDWPDEEDFVITMRRMERKVKKEC